MLRRQIFFAADGIVTKNEHQNEDQFIDSWIYAQNECSRINFAHLSMAVITVVDFYKTIQTKIHRNIVNYLFACVCVCLYVCPFSCRHKYSRKCGEHMLYSAQWYDDLRSWDTNLNTWNNTVKHSLEVCTWIGYMFRLCCKLYSIHSGPSKQASSK